LESNSGKKFNRRAIQNIVNNAKADAKKLVDENGDLATLFNRLQMLQTDNPRWFIRPKLENGTLALLLWMSPFQQLLLRYYGFVVILDPTVGKVDYGYYLTTFVLIDGNNKTKNFAYCLHSQQDTASFTWMFRNIKAQMDQINAVPIESIFSDRAGAILLAVESVWPKTFHGLCLHHIYENLKKNVQRRLGDSFKMFLADFWEVYYSGSELDFETKWVRLLNRYHGARDYLQSSLYPIRQRWAWIWVSSHFTAGTRTTGRVEGEHSVYKKKGLGRGFLTCNEKAADVLARISTKPSIN
jgi:hypothetical protein